MRYKAAITLHLTLLFFCLDGGAQGISETPKPELSAPKIRIKDGETLEWLRRHACQDCPIFEKNPEFYGLRGHGELLRSIRLNIKKPITVAGIEFDVPITIYLNDNLPNRIMTSDYRDPLPARKSPIGLISARDIPITPDGKIAKLTYPEDELKTFFKDKTAYSISEFFWDDTEKIIRPASFRAEKPFSFCGFTFEKGETLNFTYDKTWEMVPVYSFTHRNKKYDGNKSFRMTFSRQYACRAKAYKYKTGELILFNNDDATK
ncbi:MAG: hypothetical protein JNJ49_07980 [Bdellovibrionaceae bacterium]|nr:hypothetical protein [Pseudobdellovibrionaceae bacterium]